jgi:thiamine biosynthesis lipoprotein
MGTEVHVVVVGDGPTPEAGLERLAELERRWTRFDPDSELSRIGRADGRPVVASPETAMLLERCRYGWSRSDGRFDPTVVDALEQLGYDRDFDQVRSRTAGAVSLHQPAPGLADLWVEPASGLVQVPTGVRIDPGGLGKGLAADLVAVGLAADAGADYGILVSVGGDLRVEGSAPDEGWEIEIDHLVDGPARVNLRTGALATSSVMRRRWDAADGPRHHVIDPRTGRPSTGPAASVSVVAAEGWWAEVLATVLLLEAGPGGVPDAVDELLADAGALVTLHDGTVLRLGPLGDAFGSAPGRTGQEFRLGPEPADPCPGSPSEEQHRS